MRQTLESERLLLRKPRHDDLDGYARMWGDPEVMRFLGGTTRRRDEIPQGIERGLRHWKRHGIGLFTVVRKEDERFVGRVGYLFWDAERWVSTMHEEMERRDDYELEIGWAGSLASSGTRATRRRRRAPAATTPSMSSAGLASSRSSLRRTSRRSVSRTRSARPFEREDIPGPFEEKVDLYALAKEA